jgi:beta-galactosidase
MRGFFIVNTGLLLLSGLFFFLSAGAQPSEEGQLSAGAQSPRVKYNFNPGWKLFVGDPSGAESIQFDDGGWKPISLPHAFNEDDAFRKAIQELGTGIAWYRKHFRVPAGDEGKKVFLEFEGIRQAGEFFLNGHWIGRSENGVMAFGFEITDLLHDDGDNLIAVRIDNSWDYHEKASNSPFEWNDRNFYANYGGINKNVYLYVMDGLHQTLPLYSSLGTTGVYIYARDFDIPGGAATICAESQVRNQTGGPRSFRYEVELVDSDGRIIKNMDGGSFTLGAGDTTTVRAKARVSGLHFWSWGYGYLYKVNTLLKVDGVLVDKVSTTTGFRKTVFGQGMLKLNDRAMQLKGYGQRTTNEWPAIGLSVPPWMSDWSNHLMVESNANLVRWMHVTPWRQDVLSCDRVGLMEAMPAGDAEKDVEGRRWQQRVELMRDAIIYNRNNPSIVFYECGNKGISEAHMLEMKELRDRYDSYGGRAIGAREMLDSRVAEYGGEMLYINKSAGKPLWAMEYSRDEGLRKYWDEYSPPYHKDGEGPFYKGEDAAIYNRNQDSHAKEDVARWYDYWWERPGTGDRVSGGGVNIIFSESNTHYRGAENYRRSGEVDALRIPKDGYYSHKVMWNGWVDVEKPGIHILGHWNYTKGVKKDVFVVSSAEKVQLLVNGRSLGWGEQSSRFLFTFRDVEWKPGTITAIGYDPAGREIIRTSHETAGPAAAIRLTLHTAPGGVRADGADLALVDVEVTDASGRRCPTDLSMIRWSLEGPAEWRGGMAQGPENYILSKELPVECGVNRVLVRAGTTAGTIRLTASAEGLKAATLSFPSGVRDQQDGLSLQMPDDGLRAYFDRGPTPGGASYKMSRIPLKIVKAVAGSNGDKASLSYDDLETTEWHNDSSLATAWIEYMLADVVPIGEIRLKLNNFRTRSYPLRILVDGREVYRGMTQRSLGYITIGLGPASGSGMGLGTRSGEKIRGRVVRIELMDRAALKGAEGAEINGKKLEDGPGAGEAPIATRLSIIETELYDTNIP